jgi:hypothetical protein
MSGIGDIIKGCVAFGCFSAVTNIGLLLYFVPKSRPVVGVLGTLLMIKYKIDDKKYLETKNKYK